MLAGKEREDQPQYLPQPGSTYCLSFLFHKNKPNETQKKASLLMIKLLPAAARDPTSWEKKKEGWERDAKKADPAGKLYR